MTTADKATQQRPATMDEIKTLISKDDSWTVGALMTIYQKQEADEQIAGSTVHQNSVGFNGFDAPILSDMARWYISKGFLSEKQIAYIRRTIPKYIQQLMAFGVRPMDIKTTVDPKSPAVEKPAAFMKVDLIEGKLAISFSFPKGDNRFSDTLDHVKSLASRRWIAAEKRWEAPVSYDTLKSLLDWGFTISDKAQVALDGFKAPKVTLKQDVVVDNRLFPYQKDGVIFLQGKNGSALIGDEQGLGKTCQYLSYLDLNPTIRPALVICPASLKLNWEKEVKMWVKSHNKVHILEGKKAHALPKADIYIINYDILGDAKIDRKTMKPKPTGWCAILADFGFKSICADEIQRIKSSDAQRSRASLYIAKHAERRCGLSGTPIKNKAVELFNPVNFVNSQIFPSFWRFTDEFTHKEHNGFGWQFKGVKNAEKLHQILTDTIMIRRKKDDVLKDLPPKTRATIPMAIKNRKEYDRVINDFKIWLHGTYRDKSGNIHSNADNPAARMVEMEKLKQATIAGKMDMCVEWIEDFLETEKKLVIFATHKETLDILQAKFGDICVRLDGSTGKKQRQEVVDRFQTDDKVTLFLGNIIAASEGITLTAASDVTFIEFPWCPAEVMQAEDRCHRISQKDNVSCWYLVAAGTIEEPVVEMLQAKAKVLDQVLDGKSADDSSIFDELIEALK